MISLKKLFSIAAISATMSMSAHANFVLDTFEYATSLADFQNKNFDAQFTLDDSTIVPSNVPNTIDNLIAVSGAMTTFTLDNGNNVDGGTGAFDPLVSNTIFDAVAGVVPGFLNYSTGTGSTLASTLTIEYSSSALDFTQFGSFFELRVQTLNAGSGINAEAGQTFGFTVDASFEDSGTGTAVLTNPSDFEYRTSANDFSILVPFSAFTLSNGFDFTAVTSGSFMITNEGRNADLTLESISIVPTPAPIALLGLSLLGMGIYRRTRKA